MPKSKSRHSKSPVSPSAPRYLCEAEVVTGLKPYAEDELHRLLPDHVHVIHKSRREEIPFGYDGDLNALLDLHQSVAVYLAAHYPIPRPQALLGHQHFTTLLKQISTVRSMHPGGTFQTFRIAAAGSNSSVFRRIRDEITDATGLIYNEDEADLLLRVRKADIYPDGWEVLVRLSPRPLSARDWRVCDMEGALNATIAASMIEMTAPQPDDRVFNIMCGSGTLLIERLRRAPVDIIGGCDTDPIALRCAQDNLLAAGLSQQADVLVMDATQLQLPDASLDVICADLPWGQLVGSHEANLELYPAVLAEAARVAAPGARAVFITHEITLMEQTLRDLSCQWRSVSELRVFQGGLHPRIYLLERV
ncbi:MAG: methyltransferase domain-containing protein [Anaerolineae bacterium]|nr:methyltransferase domain-containing protein [Anaerolineae bacterium]